MKPLLNAIRRSGIGCFEVKTCLARTTAQLCLPFLHLSLIRPNTQGAFDASLCKTLNLNMQITCLLPQAIGRFTDDMFSSKRLPTRYWWALVQCQCSGACKHLLWICSSLFSNRCCCSQAYFSSFIDSLSVWGFTASREHKSVTEDGGVESTSQNERRQRFGVLESSLQEDVKTSLSCRMSRHPLLIERSQLIFH